MKDPYHSVERVYPQAIHALEKHDDIHYIGMKNAVQIPLRLIQRLKAHGYILHTVDRCSINGRAVDMQLRNPITGRRMTAAVRQSMYFWESMIWESERMEAVQFLLRQ